MTLLNRSRSPFAEPGIVADNRTTSAAKRREVEAFFASMLSYYRQVQNRAFLDDLHLSAYKLAK